MSTKGFLLLVATVIVIGGAIGGAFSAGLALGRGQDVALPETAALQPSFGGGQPGLGGGFSAGRLSGGFQGGQGTAPARDLQGGQHDSFGDGQSSGPEGGDHNFPGGFGGDSASRRLSGTISAVEGGVLTITTGAGETQVTVSANSTVRVYKTGTAEDLSSGGEVLVIATGNLEGGPVDAVLVIVNPPEDGGRFAGGFGGRGGFGGGASSTVFLSGTIGPVEGNVFTVTTDSGETQVALGEGSTIQVYETVAAGDLSAGDRVTVVLADGTESGEPAVAVSVIVDPPEAGESFGGRGFGGPQPTPLR